MNMELVSTVKFIFRNLIDRKQCPDCAAHWFKFNHGEHIGYYRLGDIAAVACNHCALIDVELEEQSMLRAERWFDL